MPAAAMIVLRILKWAGITVLALWLLLVAFITFFSFNFMRGPIERMVQKSTGRELSIKGDLRLKWAWPVPHVVAQKLAFGNPSWAREPNMLELDHAEATFDVSEMIKRVWVIVEARVDNPVIHLQQAADGRKNWLLDTQQKNEKSHVEVGRLIVNKGKITYLDQGRDTDISADVQTSAAGTGVTFQAKGRFNGLPLDASGTGGSIIALREETHPYPLDVEAAVGSTRARAKGTVTSLTRLTAVDAEVALQGRSLAELYDVIGIALPDTPRYSTSGHVTHKGDVWRYEKFAGKIGSSDIAGTVQVDLGRERPYLTGDVSSKLLSIADLGPMLGASPQQAKKAPAAARSRVLPDTPFDTERWDTVDADVTFRAGTLKYVNELPLQGVDARVKMNGAVLTIDPLKFSAAGGKVGASLRLDAREEPLAAKVTARAENIQVEQLLRTTKLEKAGIGRFDAAIDLAGSGNSIARILGASNGKVGVVVPAGEVSAEIMAMVAIDLWRIAKFKLAGDEPVKIRCGVADFEVKNGVASANALVFDTEPVNVQGAGTVDLRREQLDVTLYPEPKKRSLASLRTPLYVSGPFAKPKAGPDKGRLAAKGLGAVVLGAVAPLLAVLPLVDTGPGADSNCNQLVQQAKALPKEPSQAQANQRPGGTPRS
ncbi:MAG TPA: AsmA family protein [Burkholderiales bacterium]|nr:AsmA family protein [Burkholderiales bacterium]